ncbi:MAG: RNA polymerase sigma factor [Candidatus Andeanibacterium colombiense]|uniref:RNA polymerase sigma factor n=1 Tax=Candidatus Andeanibacterium colombiense TaxID=3121345 RepID=A0AAJ5X701_9SPHN|nr:MAG: RNA polymerase sigma factor [Sphingomonadaceae bacterium]
MALSGGERPALRVLEGVATAPADARPEPSPEARSETLGQAYIRQYDRMRAFLLRRTGDRLVAEELAHDVWIQIAPRAEDPAIENPDAWLRRVAVNLAINWLKANSYRAGMLRHDVELGEVAEDSVEMERALHARRGVEYLTRLVDELPPRRRAVFLLYRGRGLSLSETAEELGISIKTVKVQMTEALRVLRKRMEEAGLWP